MIHDHLHQNPVPLRIMVVDDKEEITLTFQLMLEVLGYEVRVANSGAEAATVAMSFIPQVMLMDIGMPGMDGYELCQKLKNEPELARTIFIALTGHSQPEYRERSKRAGFDHHLVKPVIMDQLLPLLTSLNIEYAA